MQRTSCGHIRPMLRCSKHDMLNKHASPVDGDVQVGAKQESHGGRGQHPVQGCEGLAGSREAYLQQASAAPTTGITLQCITCM